jgi:hypothetical protein
MNEPNMNDLSEVHIKILQGIYESFKGYLDDTFEELQTTPSKWTTFNLDTNLADDAHANGLKLERCVLYEAENERFRTAKLTLGR